MSKTKIPSRLRLAVLKRDDFKCLWCGLSSADGVKLHIDHIFPESFRGNTTFENLGTLCDQCNLSKGNEYFGNYLLTTIFKVPDIWNRVVDKDLETNIGPDDLLYYGKWHRLSIFFFRHDGNIYREVKISEHYLIPKIFLMCKNDPHSEIRVSEIKKEALLKLKNKIRDYLFENKGFIEELDNKLIFRERK